MLLAYDLPTLHMRYVSWFGSDRFGSDRFGSDRFGSDRFGSDSDWFGSDQFSVICVIIGKSPYPGNIPSIPDYTIDPNSMRSTV